MLLLLARMTLVTIGLFASARHDLMMTPLRSPHVLGRGCHVSTSLFEGSGLPKKGNAKDMCPLCRHQEYLAECVFLFAPPEVKVAASSIRDAS